MEKLWLGKLFSKVENEFTNPNFILDKKFGKNKSVFHFRPQGG